MLKFTRQKADSANEGPSRGLRSVVCIKSRHESFNDAVLGFTADIDESRSNITIYSEHLIPPGLRSFDPLA